MNQVRVKRVNLHANEYQGEWSFGTSYWSFELSWVRANGIILYLTLNIRVSVPRFHWSFEGKH